MSLSFDDFVLASMIHVLSVNVYDTNFFVLGFSLWLSGYKKNPPVMQEPQKSWLDPWLGRSPRGENGNPLQDFCWKVPWTEESGGLSPRGCKESDRTEHTCMLFFSLVQPPSMFICFV